MPKEEVVDEQVEEENQLTMRTHAWPDEQNTMRGKKLNTRRVMPQMKKHEAEEFKAFRVKKSVFSYEMDPKDLERHR